ncbi:MAG: hypothetical protein QW041_00250 [Candidatus Pacearchaeota archaeon]
MKPYLFISITVLVLIVTIIFIQKTGYQCNNDSDCVPASCCHATQCVPKEIAPNCSDIVCTAECVQNTLDCGQGSCFCEKGMCISKIR